MWACLSRIGTYHRQILSAAVDDRVDVIKEGVGYIAKMPPVIDNPDRPRVDRFSRIKVQAETIAGRKIGRFGVFRGLGLAVTCRTRVRSGRA